jgi:hypothetical protein
MVKQKKDYTLSYFKQDFEIGWLQNVADWKNILKKY